MSHFLLSDLILYMTSLANMPVTRGAADDMRDGRMRLMRRDGSRDGTYDVHIYHVTTAGQARRSRGVKC